LTILAQPALPVTSAERTSCSSLSAPSRLAAACSVRPPATERTRGDTPRVSCCGRRRNCRLNQPETVRQRSKRNDGDATSENVTSRVVAAVEVEAFCKDHFASILNIAPYFKKQPSRRHSPARCRISERATASMVQLVTATSWVRASAVPAAMTDLEIEEAA
jgi:hypothetical protein